MPSGLLLYPFAQVGFPYKGHLTSLYSLILDCSLPTSLLWDARHELVKFLKSQLEMHNSAFESYIRRLNITSIKF